MKRIGIALWCAVMLCGLGRAAETGWFGGDEDLQPSFRAGFAWADITPEKGVLMPEGRGVPGTSDRLTSDIVRGGLVMVDRRFFGCAGG